MCIYVRAYGNVLLKSKVKLGNVKVPETDLKIETARFRKGDFDVYFCLTHSFGNIDAINIVYCECLYGK